MSVSTLLLVAGSQSRVEAKIVVEERCRPVGRIMGLVAFLRNPYAGPWLLVAPLQRRVDLVVGESTLTGMRKYPQADGVEGTNRRDRETGEMRCGGRVMAGVCVRAFGLLLLRR